MGQCASNPNDGNSDHKNNIIKKHSQNEGIHKAVIDYSSDFETSDEDDSEVTLIKILSKSAKSQQWKF